MEAWSSSREVAGTDQRLDESVFHSHQLIGDEIKAKEEATERKQRQ